MLLSTRFFWCLLHSVKYLEQCMVPAAYFIWYAVFHNRNGMAINLSTKSIELIFSQKLHVVQTYNWWKPHFGFIKLFVLDSHSMSEVSNRTKENKNA